MHLAYTSFVVRMLHGADIFTTTAAALDPDTFLDLCCRHAASGVQLDLSQVPLDDARALAAIRKAYEARGLEIELSIPFRHLESPDAYARAVEAAASLGATRARVGLLYGRRYESFASYAEWQAFAARWRETLVRMRPEFDRHPLQIGIENHKDWLAPELVSLLAEIGSPRVGACLDFGNSLALLEDPDETVDRLAPYAVTTHLKDMAVAVTGEGFEMAEVPLGDGMLPLERYVAAVRSKRPDARFTLEMITRDPLPVPYRTGRYWTAFDEAARQPERVRRFERRVLAEAHPHPLPRFSTLPAEAQIDAEDRHVARSVEYAARVLQLGADDR
jgi:sugar phosphate isomerase/epimerase